MIDQKREQVMARKKIKVTETMYPTKKQLENSYSRNKKQYPTLRFDYVDDMTDTVDEESRPALSFGVRKAIIVTENIDKIKEFVEKHSLPVEKKVQLETLSKEEKDELLSALLADS